MAIKNHLCQSGFGDDLMEGKYFNGCDILSIPRGNLAIITSIDDISCVPKQNNSLFCVILNGLDACMIGFIP